jgi:hypothetical protein
MASSVAKAGGSSSVRSNGAMQAAAKAVSSVRSYLTGSVTSYASSTAAGGLHGLGVQFFVSSATSVMRAFGRAVVSVFAPSSRFAAVPFEERLSTVTVEVRSASVSVEDRVATVPTENRSANIPVEDRSSTVPKSM